MGEFKIDTRCATPGMEAAIAEMDDEKSGTEPLSKIDIFDCDGRKKSQATLLIEIGEQSELFHDSNHDAYAEIKQKDFSVVYPVRSKDFREYLSHELYKLIDKGANATAITDAINTLEAIAKHKGSQYIVALRTHYNNDIFIDTGCDKWRVIHVSNKGYSFTNKATVKFTRKRGMLSLPEPGINANFKLLDKYLNVNQDELPLIYGWMFCALAGIKPYPILVLQGEQGTGKSTTCRVIRSLIDPSTVPLRSPPKSVRNLLVSAANNHVVVLDNLSGLSPEISDCLCRLSTGGGIDIRALFTDSEQYLVDLQKPVLINGIDDIATRPDLAQRSLIINLPVIESGDRRNERDFWQDFERDKPSIISALLSAISSGLKHYDSVEIANKPRMADVAQWVTACERELNIEGDFLLAHEQNQQQAIENSIETSPVGSTIMALMSERNKWIGKPTELMAALEGIAGTNQIRSKAWPQSLKGLNNSIKRLMPSLRSLGISIVKYTSGNREYKIENSRFYPPEPPEPPETIPGKGYSAGGYKTYPPDKAVNRPNMADKKTNCHSVNPGTALPVADKAVKALKNQKIPNNGETF